MDLIRAPERDGRIDSRAILVDTIVWFFACLLGWVCACVCVILV